MPRTGARLVLYVAIAAIARVAALPPLKRTLRPQHGALTIKGGSAKKTVTRNPRAVVVHLGSATALELLAYTEQVQASGGMYVPETGKPRTHGGVFLQLLKEANHLPWEAQQAALHRIKVEGKNVKAWEKASVPGWS